MGVSDGFLPTQVMCSAKRTLLSSGQAEGQKQHVEERSVHSWVGWCVDSPGGRVRTDSVGKEREDNKQGRCPAGRGSLSDALNRQLEATTFLCSGLRTHAHLAGCLPGSPGLTLQPRTVGVDIQFTQIRSTIQFSRSVYFTATKATPTINYNIIFMDCKD